MAVSQMEYSGQTVWITGASSGIGAGLARTFAGEGAAIILSGRNEKALAEVADASRKAGAVDTLCLPFEVTDYEALPALVETAEAWRGGIDVLVNNAGVSQRSLFRDTSMSVYRTLMDVDFFAPVALVKAVLPGMERRGSGLICVTSSVAGKVGSKLRTGYCAAKHALHGFFDCLRAEIHGDGIRIVLIVPAYVQSDVARHAVTGDGSPFNKREAGHDQAMTADEAGRIILRKMKKGQEEILVGSGPGIIATYLKRFLPGLYARALRKQPLE